MLKKKLKMLDIDETNGEPSKLQKLNTILDSSLSNCEQTEQSKYFADHSSVNHISIAEGMVQLQKTFNETLQNMSFLKCPIEFVYNPTIYASKAFEKYITLYCNTEKKIILLGINPGPWGMCQTGVPFGEITSVKNWLQIEESVAQPESVCNKRKIDGFNCKNTEVSGYKMWKFFKEMSVTPKCFFKNAIILNYCPIAFMKKNGTNITPKEMEVSLRNSLQDACDQNLAKIIKLLKPEFIIGIGRYAEERALFAIKSVSSDIKVIYMPHPSPRVPNNKDWHEKAKKCLEENGLIKYFQ